jgi:hypothetical protein
MKSVSEYEIPEVTKIGKAVRRDYARELEALEIAGEPSKALLTLAAFVAARYLETSAPTKKALRYRQRQAQESGQKGSARKIGDLLSRQGRRGPDLADQGIAILLRSIVRIGRARAQRFDTWEPLARVLAAAFIAAGVAEQETKHITADMLRKAARRIEMESDTWPSHTS